MINKDFAERLKKIRSALGLSQREIAEKIDGNFRTWQAYESAKSVPGGRVLEALTNLGVNGTWLLTGTGPMFVEDKTTPEPGNTRADQKDVAVYDVKTSAGGGFLNFGEKVAGYITLPVDYIRKQLGVNPEDICAIFVDGDSMEPHFTTGDMILLDCSERARNSKGDGIYTFRIEDQLFVKRLQHQGTRLIAQSDNPAYNPWEISDHEKANMKILARVVGTFRNL